MAADELDRAQALDLSVEAEDGAIDGVGDPGRAIRWPGVGERGASVRGHRERRDERLSQHLLPRSGPRGERDAIRTRLERRRGRQREARSVCGDLRVDHAPKMLLTHRGAPEILA